MLCPGLTCQHEQPLYITQNGLKEHELRVWTRYTVSKCIFAQTRRTLTCASQKLIVKCYITKCMIYTGLRLMSPYQVPVKQYKRVCGCVRRNTWARQTSYLMFGLHPLNMQKLLSMFLFVGRLHGWDGNISQIELAHCRLLLSYNYSTRLNRDRFRGHRKWKRMFSILFEYYMTSRRL